MFKNYFKIATRNIWRHKGFSAINIFGLAIGLAVCLLITLFVVEEFSYDKYNTRAADIYRVYSDFKVNGSLFKERESPAPLATIMMKEYPRVEQATRIKESGKTLVRKGNQTIIEPNSFYVDPNIFTVFTLPMIAGDPKTALLESHTIVITKKVALKYFNSTDVIGKTLHLDNTDDYKITGVLQDVPEESHIHFNILKSMTGNTESRSTQWTNVEFNTYILVRKGTTQAQLDGYLKQATRKYADAELQQFIHTTIAALEQKGDHFTFATTLLTAIHLHSPLTTELEPAGNIQYVYIFTIIAIFILVIACINFVNLSTASSAGRAKEVGVRKVLGSNRLSLVYQFLTESVLTSFMALLIAVAVAMVMLPYFNGLAGRQLMINLSPSNWTTPVLIVTALTIGILAGLYPAFYLSAFQPIYVLKGKLTSGFKGSFLRNGLVVFQFAAVIILIVGTLVIYTQLDYIRNKNLGYNREQVLVLRNTYALGNHIKAFREEALNLPGVKSITTTGFLPTEGKTQTQVYHTNEGSNAGQSLSLATWQVDCGYIPTLGMKVAKGRNFSPAMKTDSDAVIINESAVNMLGLRDPLNKSIYMSGDDQVTPHKIVGIVKDFNTGSLRNKVQPLLLRLRNNNAAMAFRIDTKNVSSTINRIKDIYYKADANMAGQPFDFSFMDDDFNRLYRSEQNTGKIFMSFAFFAILIACLGLFGLVTYAAEQRTKEIGIRKVLGASISSIVGMLSTDFLKLVGIAAVIACPAAWWAMSKWLQDFAYRTTISWWVFVIAGLLAVLITLVTVSFRVIKAALMNPVKSLRSE
ncbi:ABC transporter permease [Mucilaginibacter terrenus]|uniref:ABC transporter permease n=1 Tax=Mucilaginibacter terrenus TaxID=2482727 RepID=A0A3E2NVP6_9SPHI|nr:ABC transporter permease [Mucilaginibacter terrenus]RFZ84930.1 ABC transporter permease [Mucilaginibacter terrenus]